MFNIFGKYKLGDIIAGITKTKPKVKVCISNHKFNLDYVFAKPWVYKDL